MTRKFIYRYCSLKFINENNFYDMELIKENLQLNCLSQLFSDDKLCDIINEFVDSDMRVICLRYLHSLSLSHIRLILLNDVNYYYAMSVYILRKQAKMRRIRSEIKNNFGFEDLDSILVTCTSNYIDDIHECNSLYHRNQMIESLSLKMYNMAKILSTY